MALLGDICAKQRSVKSPWPAECSLCGLQIPERSREAGRQRDQMNGRRNHFIYANPCQALGAAAVSGELCPSGVTWMKILLSTETLCSLCTASGVLHNHPGESSRAEAGPSAGSVGCPSALRFPGLRSPQKVEANGTHGLFLHRGAAAAVPVSTQALAQAAQGSSGVISLQEFCSHLSQQPCPWGQQTHLGHLSSLRTL